MSSMTLFSIDISNVILFSSIKQEITLFYIQNILFGTIAPIQLRSAVSTMMSYKNVEEPTHRKNKKGLNKPQC